MILCTWACELPCQRLVTTDTHTHTEMLNQKREKKTHAQVNGIECGSMTRHMRGWPFGWTGGTRTIGEGAKREMRVRKSPTRDLPIPSLSYVNKK